MTKLHHHITLILTDLRARKLRLWDVYRLLQEAPESESEEAKALLELARFVSYPAHAQLEHVREMSAKLETSFDNLSIWADAVAASGKSPTAEDLGLNPSLLEKFRALSRAIAGRPTPQQIRDVEDMKAACREIADMMSGEKK